MRSATVMPARHDRLIREHVHDPYKTRLKLPEPSACARCGAVFERGRWRWGSAPRDARKVLCQACHRIRDQFPAGSLSLAGDFARGHREEVLGIARNQEAGEKAEHPLHRIMGIEEHPEAIIIRTTDIHLPRRIGEALHRAFKGELEVHYAEGTYNIRVRWSR